MKISICGKQRVSMSVDVKQVLCKQNGGLLVVTIDAAIGALKESKNKVNLVSVRNRRHG